MSFSAMPVVISAYAATTMTNPMLLGGGSGRPPEKKDGLSDDDKFAIGLIGAFVLPVAALFAFLGLHSATERTETYELTGKVYASDLRTTGSKSSKRTNMVFVSVQAPNGATSVHGTGYHVSKCPKIDYDTPVRMQVTVVRSTLGDKPIRRWSAALAAEAAAEAEGAVRRRAGRGHHERHEIVAR